MKNPNQDPNSKPLLNKSAEEPMIRPLDARRVPSATGAAFTLPVLPDGGDEAPVEVIPEAVEVPIDETFEPILIIDPVVEEGGEEPLPVDFENVIDLAYCGGVFDGEVTDPVEVPLEEFNPDVIFYTLFTGGPETGGELPPGEDGEVVIDDGTFTGEEPEVAVCDGLIVKEDATLEEGEGEVPAEDGGSPEIVEEPAFVDKDGDLIDDVTGEPIKVPIEWVIRGNTSAEGGETVDNPEIYYMTGGAPVPTSSGPEGDHSTDHQSDPEPTATPAHTAHDHAAPVPETAAPAPATPASSDLTFEIQSAAPASVLTGAQFAPLGATVPTIENLDHAPLAHHSDIGAHSVELASFAPEIVHPAAATGESVTETSFDQHEATVDQWVPQVAEHSDTILPVEGLTHDHGADTALPASQEPSALNLGALRGNGIAMALTGAVLVARDATKRDEESKA